jgi:hypothetical protein
MVDRALVPQLGFDGSLKDLGPEGTTVGLRIQRGDARWAVAVTRKRLGI